MSWRRDRYHELGEVFRRNDVDPDVREELDHHLASRIEENVRAGMTREEAAAEARRRFGDLERYRRETRAVERGHRSSIRRRERIALALQEARRAVRALVRTPTFTVAAVATLALGIGGTTAIFTLVDAIALRPLAYPAADRLVRVYHPVPKVGPGARWGISAAEFFHFRRHARTLDAIGVARTSRYNLSLAGRASQVNGGMVSASLLPLLGIRPVLGRLLTDDDNTRRKLDVVLLSERIWREQFGADSSLVGAEVRVEGSAAQVVGIVTGAGLPGAAVDLWLPQPLDPGARAYNDHSYFAVARLADGVTPLQAEAELRSFLATYTETFPSAYSQAFMDRTGFTIELVPLKQDVVGDAARLLWVLLAAVGLVLAIACFNIGNLFLVRVHARRREVAVRSVLGASRGQIAWHHLSESLVLSLGAGVLGIGLAWAGLRLFLGFLPGGRDPRVAALLPRLAEVQLGWVGVLFALGVALAAGVLFGLAPLFLSLRAGEALRRAGRGLTPSRRETAVRGGLVVAQIVMAVVLLAGAGLMLRTIQQLRMVEPGFDPTGVLAIDLALPYSRYQRHAESASWLDRLARRVEALPGVTRAGFGSDLPLEMGRGGCAIMAAEAKPADGGDAVRHQRGGGAGLLRRARYSPRGPGGHLGRSHLGPGRSAPDRALGASDLGRPERPRPRREGRRGEPSALFSGDRRGAGRPVPGSGRAARRGGVLPAGAGRRHLALGGAAPDGAGDAHRRGLGPRRSSRWSTGSSARWIPTPRSAMPAPWTTWWRGPRSGSGS